MSKFDAQFFGIHGRQADNMDPQARILNEVTYEAIVDAGCNPQTLRGSRTGVYIGGGVSEVEEGLVTDVSKVTGYALTGCSRSMFSNRLSFTFDFQGPSYTMDTACSSAFSALEAAYLGMRTNQCDQAVVGGVNICVRPATAVQFKKLNMLSPEGRCAHLDESANGYARSEACSVVFLQKKKDAKRVYGTLIHAKTNTDGFKSEGITYPSSISQAALMRETVTEAGIDPNEVGYIEAHGTGTKVGDPVEVKSIASVYCQNRKDPLLIGSVKSNLGHAEIASGMNSLAKLCATFQKRMIPANLHFSNPNPNIPELTEGKVKPVVENTPFDDRIVAVNSFGFGGVNVHALIKPHTKELPPEHSQIVDKIPRLIIANGRTEDGVNHIFDFIEQNPEKVNNEFLALLTELAQTTESSGMVIRGYALADKHPDKEVQFPREIVRFSEKRPVWFVYSGMGSQWAAMAKGMMVIDIFRESIERSQEIMKGYCDVMDLIMNEDEKTLDTTVAPFVSIAAVQIALTDVLYAMNIRPDGIVGHSVGELGCAYADGCFDQKQMLMAAYWRGKCVEDAHLPRGLMAAVGLSWEEATTRCPKGVVPACHNSADSVTISGSYDETKAFVEQLKSENIFAREVKSCDVSFHSYFMESIGPVLLKKLEEVLPEKKLRSPKWVCSSIPESRWDEDLAKYSAPAYYVNNLQSPVYFHSAVQHVPKNAIVIEIAPHTLLQAIIKRTLGSDVSYIPLMRRNNNDGNVNTLLTSLGKLYNLGLNPEISSLYPKVEFPVSRNVESLSSLIKWDHSQSWLVTLYPDFFNPSYISDYNFKIDLNENPEFADHVVDERNLFPATGYLFYIWQMLGKMKGQYQETLPVTFENVAIHRATLLNKDQPTKFAVQIMDATGDFTISEGGNVIVTGVVRVPEKEHLTLQNLLTDGSVKSTAVVLENEDFYKELRLRGYDYGPYYRSIIEATADGTFGKVQFKDWILLADNMLQLLVARNNDRCLRLPVRFQSVRCDPKILYAETAKGEPIQIINDERLDVIVAPGLEIYGPKANMAPRRAIQEAVLEQYKFTPFMDSAVSVKQNELNDYINATSMLAYKVSQLSSSKNEVKKLFSGSSTKVDEKMLKQYLDDEENSNYVLFNVLKQILVNNGAGQVEQNLEDDFISTLYEAPEFLRIPIDICMNNHTLSRVNVLEVNPTSRLLVDQVTYNIKCAEPCHLNYTLLTTEDTEIKDVNVFRWAVNSQFPIDANESNDFAVYKDASILSKKYQPVDYSHLLKSLSGCLKKNAFLTTVFRTKLSTAEQVVALLMNRSMRDPGADYAEFKEAAQKHGFMLVSERTDSLSTTVSLFRKVGPMPPVDKQLIFAIESEQYNWVSELKKKMQEYAKRPDNENIWLVNKEPMSGAAGLMTSLRLEPGGNRVRLIQDGSFGNDPLPKIDFSKPMFANILQSDISNTLYRDGKFGMLLNRDLPRELPDKDVEHAILNIATRGDLSSLRWYEAPHKYWDQTPDCDKKKLISVYYAPLNFRDIMLATGKLPADALPNKVTFDDFMLGLEYVGRDQEGNRVMGCIPFNGLATTVVADKDAWNMWKVPDNWSMEEAATVPCAYLTAYYSLLVRGDLTSQDTVLIHSGSGAVGQAAIGIALHMGCTVYTTVGTHEKREFLKKKFPKLTDRNIAYSRDCSFEQHLLRETDGHGVDVVLNSLSEEKLQATVRCLAQHGRFLEIGKYDLSQNNPLGMAAFLKNITFNGVLLDALFSDTDPHVQSHRQLLSKMLEEGIRSGAVQPLNRTVFEMSKAETAFRYMTTGRHMGKVLLKIRDEEPQKKVKPQRLLVKATPQTLFNPTKSYILCGGLGGLGIEMALWMAKRGATKFMLTSRNGPREPFQHYSLQRLRTGGANVMVTNHDFSKINGTKRIIKDAERMGPIGGIFNLATILLDGFFENQSPDTFEKVCKAKVLGTKNMDAVSREQCPDLDYFVVFSSITANKGNPGQTNYGFANSYMERVCERRQADGLPALAMQFSVISDTGLLGDVKNMVMKGTIQQRIPSVLDSIDRFMQMPFPVVTTFVRSKHVEQKSDSKNAIQVVANILGLQNAQNLSNQTTLAELGLDSLMAVEVKQTLEREFAAILSLQEIRDLTFGKLADLSGEEAPKKEFDAKLEAKIPKVYVTSENTEKLNEVAEGRPIFFFPPIEGTWQILAPLAEQLTRPAIGINWSTALEDITDLNQATDHFIEQIKQFSSLDEELDFVAYSMGTLCAFTVALRLQKMNKKSKINLIFLDATPITLAQSVRNYVEERKKHLGPAYEADEKTYMAETLTLLMTTILPIGFDKMRETLLMHNTLEEQVEKARKLFQEYGSPDFTSEDLTNCLRAFRKKLQLAEKFQITEKFNGDITLIRASEAFVRDVPRDYHASSVSPYKLIF